MNDRPLLKVGIGLVTLAIFGVTACQQLPFVKSTGGSGLGSHQGSTGSPVATSQALSSVQTSGPVSPATSPGPGTATPGAGKLVMVLPDSQPGAGQVLPISTTVITTTQPVTPKSLPASTQITTAVVVQQAPNSTPNVKVNPAESTPSGNQAQNQQRYQLCGQSDATTGKSVGQFIAGRNFSAELVSGSNGCASLTVTILPGQNTTAPGSRSSTHLSVTTNARKINVDIVSENGTTRASVASTS